MLLRILKSNTLLSALLIPVIGLLFWMHSLQAPKLLDLDLAHGAMPLYYMVIRYFKNQDFWQVFMGFSLVIVNSLIIAQLGSSFIFLKKRSYLPGIIYLITVSSLQVLHALLPVHLATLFVLISIYFTFDTFHKKVEITYTFNASFFLAIASLFYIPVVVLFPLVWISIFVLQKDDNWRLLAVPILGFGVPWLFMWVYSFLTDSYTILWNELINMLWTRHNEYLLQPYFLLLTFVVAFLTTLGSISVIAVYQRIKVSARKYFVICYWFLGLIVVSALGLITISIEIVALSTIPVAYFVSQYLLSDNRTKLKEVLTWLFVGTAAVVLVFYV
jgi:hypothetical protein